MNGSCTLERLGTSQRVFLEWVERIGRAARHDFQTLRASRWLRVECILIPFQAGSKGPRSSSDLSYPHLVWRHRLRGRPRVKAAASDLAACRHISLPMSPASSPRYEKCKVDVLSHTWPLAPIMPSSVGAVLPSTTSPSGGGSHLQDCGQACRCS